MITGASSGLGRVTALELARMGASLTLVCRNRSRGEEVLAEIRDKTGNRTVTLMLADLSVQQQIRDLATAFLDRGEPLHVLVNNAGLFNLRRELTADGIETVFDKWPLAINSGRRYVDLGRKPFHDPVLELGGSRLAPP